jgi:starvation-inducible DNA-binding protein
MERFEVAKTLEWERRHCLADFGDPAGMLSEFREDDKALVLRMRAVRAPCDDAGDVVTASFLENWIDQAQRRNWFLFESTRI